MSTLPDTISTIAADGERAPAAHLSALFGNMSALHERDGVAAVLRSVCERAIYSRARGLQTAQQSTNIFSALLATPLGSVGLHASAGFQQRFLRARDMPNEAPAGLDLLALLIQRGRDHGLASWTSVREAVGESPIAAVWSEIDDAQLLRDGVDLRTLSRVYATPADVDLLVGGLAGMVAIKNSG